MAPRHVPQRAADRTLREVEQRFRAIFEHAPIGMTVTTLEGVLVHVNPAMCRILGYTREALVGRDVTELTHPDDVAGTQGALDVFRVTPPDSLAFKKRFVHHDGHEVWVSVHTALMRDEDGMPSHLVSQITDITERVRLERRLAVQREELERSNRELEQFAQIASHDLREPLRVIAGYLDLLDRRHGEALNAEGRELVGSAVDASQRLSDLIDGLLRISRVGRAQAERERVCAKAVVERTVEGLRTAIDEAGASVEVGDLPTVDADPALLGQLFQNLLANAVKFRNGAPPKITVSGETLDDGWRFTVQDNGIGVPADQADRIFGMFHRAPAADDRYDGTGIGLAVCQRIVERHDGTISVAPVADGPGSRFTFTLAASDDPASR